MRLTDSPEFERVYRQGIVYRGKLFSVHAYANDLGVPRLGLSVSKKVGNAVTRNAIRRKVKEVFHETSPAISADLDFVVSARPAAAGATIGELNDEFSRALRKLISEDDGQKAHGKELKR